MRKNKLLRWVLFIFVALALCACLLAALVYLGRSERSFGPASPELNPLQRFILGGYLWFFSADLDSPAGDPAAVVELEIAPGENATAVVARLASLGVVENDVLLRSYLQYRGLDKEIEAGNYTIQGSMTLREIGDLLQRAELDIQTITILEGWRREQIAEAVSRSKMNISAEAFLRATEKSPDGASLSEAIPVFATLEGFLFPDTYAIDQEMSASEFVNRLLDNFEVRVDDATQLGFFNQGLDLYQAVTLASIIEREAIVDDERRTIAGVFLNRFAMGMNLEADPTVQYALGNQPEGNWWKAPLSLADLNVDSPYNTYLYPGLPPGPIANPGLGALQAVADPEETQYLYFRAMCDGSGRHAFAVTFEEHQQNACQ